MLKWIGILYSFHASLQNLFDVATLKELAGYGQIYIRATGMIPDQSQDCQPMQVL